MDNDILIKPQLRACLVQRGSGIAEPEKAFFHRWVTVTEYKNRAYGYYEERIHALVEYENGRCETVPYTRLRFLDSGALFYDQGWPDDEDIPLF